MRKFTNSSFFPPVRLERGQTLLVATHNAGKLHEIGALLAPHGLTCQGAAALELPEPEETAPDFAGNARLKARAAAAASCLPALADDSGFCVAALGGAPGVLSARWAGPDKNFTRAMQRVATEAAGAADHRAWFVCALCLAWPDGQSATYVGRADGHFAWPPRGSHGFGYDPMFVPHGGSQTYGEMAHAEKEKASHRAKAFAQLAAALLP